MKDKFLPALASVIVTSIALTALAYLSSNILSYYFVELIHQSFN